MCKWLGSSERERRIAFVPVVRGIAFLPEPKSRSCCHYLLPDIGCIVPVTRIGISYVVEHAMTIVLSPG